MKLTIIVLLFVPMFLHAKHPMINVLIGRNLKSITVSGLDIKKQITGYKSFQLYQGKKSLKFNCNALKKFKTFKGPLKIASLHSSTGLIRWDKTAYQGKLNLIASADQNGCDLINELSLEDYLQSLLAKEMNAKWPLEALKAQAVAARSYAYHKIRTQQVSKNAGFKTFYDLENSEKHQVNGSFFDTTKRTQIATKKTIGEILKLPSGKLTPIFFHAKCGGKTFKPSQIWTNKVDGYTSVNCPFCHNLGKKDWQLIIPRSRFNLVVDKTLKSFYQDQLQSRSEFKMKIVPDQKHHTQIRLYDDDRLIVLQKSRLRSVLGRDKAPSNYYQLENKNDKVILKGKGLGHGVGMCQLGALEMAKRGMNYKQILSHYFPKHVIEKIY